MHSRIIQIESHPIDDEDLAVASDYWDDHWFTNNIADYTDDDGDRAGSLEWLKETLAAAKEYIEYFVDDDGEGFVFGDGFHAAYFSDAYAGFAAALKALAYKASPATFQDDSISTEMYNLKNAYDDKFGFYIQNYDMGLVTLNKFLRNAKAGARYYFGGTVDYHW